MPAGVVVDGVGMQSFFAVHGCGDGGLLGSIKLSSKRGLDVEAAAAMLRRSVQNRSLPDVLSRQPASRRSFSTARFLTSFLNAAPW